MSLVQTPTKNYAKINSISIPHDLREVSTECLKASAKPEPSRRLCHTVYTTHVSSTNGTSRLVRGPLSCLYSSTRANIRKYDRLSWMSQPFNERKA